MVTYLFYIDVFVFINSLSSNIRRFNLTSRVALSNTIITNPTILKIAGDYITLVARNIDLSGERRLSSIQLQSYKYNLNVTELSPLNFTDSVKWKADPRSFKFRGEYYISYNTGHSESPNNIYLQRLDENGTLLGKPYKLILYPRKAIEKNWLFFEYNNQLYCIYEFSPFTVLKCSFNHSNSTVTCDFYSKQDVSYPTLNFGQIRGGAGPILINNSFIALYQCHTNTILGKNYKAGFVSFTHKNNCFILESYTRRPCLSLSLSEYLQFVYPPLNPKINSVFYPCGIFYYGGNIFISYGINDCFYNILSVDSNHLNSLLIPIA